MYPSRGEDIKPVMAYLAENRLNNDVIYVYYGAVPAFQYYAPFYGFESKDYNCGISARKEPHRYIADIESFKGKQRVWFVFSHNCSWCVVNEQDFFLEHLDRQGVKIGEFVSEGAATYLYDLSQPP